MTEPSRSFPEIHATDGESTGQLDPTLARPEGAAVPSPFRKPNPEPEFGPPENPDEVGKIGRYRVLKKLGQGGMGAVYLGFDVTLGRRVALKVMLPAHAADPESRERFLREARAAAMVQSDHVVTIFDVGEEGGVAFIAMEYLLGSPLDQYLRANGELPLEQVFRIGRETAQGLAAAHDLGLVHRDIKPGNVWLEAPHGRVKILDFGLARAQDDDTHLTTSGMVVGTPAFMSPEQARGLKLDGRSDLFSLGVMLYRLTTGKMPFDGTTAMALLTSLAVDQPKPARQVKATVPEALEAVIDRLLAKNPDERYQTAWEVVAALRAAEVPGPASGAVPVVVQAVPMAVPVQSGNVWEGIGASESVAQLLEPGTETAVPPASGPKPARKVPRVIPALVGVALVATVVAIAAVAVLLTRPVMGTLLVESEDPDAEILIRKDGETVRARTKDREIWLAPGNYTGVVVGGRAGTRLNPEAFEIVGKEKTRVRMVLDLSRPFVVQITPPSEPDRKAAEYVLSVGGVVRVVADDRNREIKFAADLPQGPFVLTGIAIAGNARTTDAGLAVFRECKSLKQLNLDNNSNVTDAGLEYFKDCKGLTSLVLSGTTRVTDAGLAHFAGCTELTELSLHDRPVTKSGLFHFRDSKKLTYLVLKGTPTTDAGLAHFKGCADLAHLDLNGTGVTGPGLNPFKTCTNLTTLFVVGTKVTKDQAAELAKALPRCRIEYTGGTFEPTKK